MNVVGIDVSEGKSMVTAIRPFGELVAKPFEVRHTSSELSELAKRLKSLDGETRAGLLQIIPLKSPSLIINLDRKAGRPRSGFFPSRI